MPEGNMYGFQARRPKTERLLTLMKEIRQQEDLTPKRLAQKLGVSERTVYRYLRLLENNDLLAKRYSRRQRQYVLEPQTSLEPIRFTPQEALALEIAASNPAIMQGSIFAKDLQNAMNKIRSMLDAATQREVNRLKQHVSIDTDTYANYFAFQTIMLTLQNAFALRRKVRIRYWAASTNQEEENVIHPLHLTFREHHWYLLAFSERHGEVRLFRVSRIREAEMLPQKFRKPTRFDPDTWFERSWGVWGKTDEVIVKVKFSPRVAQIVRDTHGRRFYKMEMQPDGSMICIAETYGTKEISWWILSWGPDAEVLEPEYLRQEFATMTQAMAAIYAPQGTAATSGGT